MNLEQMLKEHGHEVAVFSQHFPLNEASVWDKFWPSEFKMKPSLTMVDSLLRPFGLGSVQKCFNAILDAFHPDIVHLNNIHTQLSPILAEIAHRRAIRVVWTIHDSKLVCPCYTCMRDSHWCDECFTDKRALLRHKCMTGGALGSFIGYHEARKWSAVRLQQSVDTFICPSQFMADTMQKGGFLAEKLRVMSNFIDARKVAGQICRKEDYYVFLGRLSSVKGIKTLCQAAVQLPYKLMVIGGGPLEKELRSQYQSAQNIEFLGQLQWEQIKPILSKARFMVIPSEWSENNPISIIESLSLGTPVLGANIGGIPELIDPTRGMTFQSGDCQDLVSALQKIWDTPFDYAAIAHDAIEQYQAETYYTHLLSTIYEA